MFIIQQFLVKPDVFGFETLYIMLLQKREENAITLASTANNGRIIKAALPSKKPVSPKKMVVMLAALVLGMAKSRRPPKANIGTPEKVSEGVWRLWIDSPEERIVTYHL